MSADDDPEARIRELERPLADLASAKELTVASAAGGEWAPEHGGAPTLGSRRRGVGFGAVGAVFAIAALGMFLMSREPVGTTAGTPAMPSSSVTTAPSSPEPLAAAPLPAAPPAEAPAPVPAPAGTPLAISGAGETKTLDCAGRYISVSGVSNTVTLTGRCAGLTVSGVGNVITVDESPTITASGLNNRVTYRSGDPDIATSGYDNVIQRG
ncbi:DUF3060 domain-containing protein [Mycobacterium sp. UM_Kg1]|uniref:DUF3060 domain-containing protein n=1 Tax=Mycobacterium sp. UM_Kg1 TaxID=1545691 RepID=UPI00061AB14E|nr:DUF3060 domain-containing protein [Mycobacterium sp. UM_Kg1]